MPNTNPLLIQTRAWMVHLYTASGGIFALLSLIALDQELYASCLLWLMVCFFIDGTDGLLARRWRVREILPGIEGKNIDQVLDFITYAFIPAYFIYRSTLVDPDWRLPLAAYVILISAFYYGRRGMVNDQQRFRGFPVLWNLVIFYEFFVFESGPLLNTVLILFFGLLHFLPVQISYPSQHLRSNPWMFIISLGLLLVFMTTLIVYPMVYPLLKVTAFAALAYYTFLTIYQTWFRKD